MLKIYSSETKQKIIFQPLHHQKIGIYACGITVYDLCHLGHARTSLALDVAVRYLRYLNYQVTYVRNITDIDDKIIDRAQQLGCSAKDLSIQMTAEMEKDFDALGLMRPDHEPRATDYIQEMQAMIARLLEKGFAYIHPLGDVYFRVTAFDDYGSLSKQKVDFLSKSSRVSNDRKENNHDFVLWKRADDGGPSAPVWPSPWGQGRPGWHIECSAMSQSLLGDTFDIHAGGCDLKFPHHENERAQSICANQAPFVNCWMHIGMVTVKQEKMAKSLGNFLTIRALLQDHHPELIRMFLIQSHYRTPLDFNPSNLNLADQKLQKLYGALRGLPIDRASTSAFHKSSKFSDTFHEAMCDDFNTPLAVSVLLSMASEIFKFKQEKNLEDAVSLAHELQFLISLLGIKMEDPEAFFQDSSKTYISKADILEAIDQRNQARLSKDWTLADSIRQNLLKQNIYLEDQENETLWRRGSSFEK